MTKTFTIQAHDPKGINNIHVQTGAAVATATVIDYSGREYSVIVKGIYPDFRNAKNMMQYSFCGNIRVFKAIRFAWMLEK